MGTRPLYAHVGRLFTAAGKRKIRKAQKQRDRQRRRILNRGRRNFNQPEPCPDCGRKTYTHYLVHGSDPPSYLCMGCLVLVIRANKAFREADLSEHSPQEESDGI